MCKLEEKEGVPRREDVDGGGEAHVLRRILEPHQKCRTSEKRKRDFRILTIRTRMLIDDIRYYKEVCYDD